MGGMFVALTIVERDGWVWRWWFVATSLLAAFVDAAGQLSLGRFAQPLLKRQQSARLS